MEETTTKKADKKLITSFEDLPQTIKGYFLNYDEIDENGNHKPCLEIFKSKKEAEFRYKNLMEYEVEGKNKGNYKKRQVNLLNSSLKERQLQKNKLDLVDAIYHPLNGKSFTITKEDIDNLKKNNKDNKDNLKNNVINKKEEKIIEDVKTSSNSNETKKDEYLSTYERLYNVENRVMKYLKENYEIPPEYQDDEKLLSLVHSNFTMSKIGQLDIENKNDMLEFNDLELYNYTDIDNQGNLINVSKLGDKHIVKEPIVFKAKHIDEIKLTKEEQKAKTAKDKAKLDEVGNIFKEISDLKPLIFKDIYNNEVDKKIEYLKEKIKNEKNPLHFDRTLSILKDIAKNKYLFLGAMFFWPSAILYLGMCFLALKGIELYSKVSSNIQKKRRLSKVKEEINHTLDGLNRDLSNLYNLGKDSIKQNKPSKDIEKSQSKEVDKEKEKSDKNKPSKGVEKAKEKGKETLEKDKSSKEKEMELDK